MATLSEKFSENLLRTRGAKKLTQEALAAKAGLSVSYISMLERAQRSPPLDTLELLGKALGVAPVALLA